MSKLNVGQNAGYTKSVNDTVQENYPNTIVEAVYWDKEKKPLGEVLEDIVTTAPMNLTEAQKEQVRENIGVNGGVRVIVSTANWEDIPAEGSPSRISTLAELSAYVGIDENDLEYIFEENNASVIVVKTNAENVVKFYFIFDALYDGEDREIRWFNNSGNEIEIDYYENPGGTPFYEVYGLGQD